MQHQHQSAWTAIECNPLVNIVQRLGYSLKLIQKAVNLKKLELAMEELLDAIDVVQENEISVQYKSTSQVIIILIAT
jgi:hypothetical protein